MERLAGEMLSGWRLAFHDDLAGHLRVAELFRSG